MSSFTLKKSLRSLRPEADLREGSLRLCGELDFYEISILPNWDYIRNEDMTKSGKNRLCKSHVAQRR